MKNIVQFMLAGAVGGAITLGGARLMTHNNHPTAQNTSSLAKFTSFGSMPAIDLSGAATTASPTVVYIEAAESQASAQKRMQQSYENDPWAQFFGFRFQQPQKKGTGSGVIISEDGYIVTNNHVIDFADEVKVTLTDERSFMAKVVGTDPRTDLAVLKIAGSSFPFVTKGDSENLKVGDWVLAIGNPYQLRTTVTAGIVSAKGKKLGVNEERGAVEDFIQTDAVVNPGNSGGALVDGTGKLVGINTAIQTHTGSYEGYSFAIPVNMMTKVVDDIIKFGKVKRSEVSTPNRLNGTNNNGNNNNGTATGRPMLGIEMVQDQYFAEIVKERDLHATQGVIVEKVANGGSAQYAGILPNDVIVEVNGKTVLSTKDLREHVAKAKLGDVLTMTVNRDGKIQKVPVTLRAAG
jgi:S1-C subfamily serine protease